MSRVPLLALVLALGGCLTDDCTSGAERVESFGGFVLADGRALGDTLTVAFVRTSVVPLEVAVDPGVAARPDSTADGSVELVYDAVSRTASSLRVPLPLGAATRGDTLYVYARGTVDPTRLACSLPPIGVEVRVRALAVPPGVVAARVTVVDVASLSEPAAAALRQSEAAARAARTITA